MTTKPNEHATESRPGPTVGVAQAADGGRHEGVRIIGEDGDDGRKAFYINIEALPGKEEQVVKMLRDILGFVEGEPATGPWFGVRFSRSTFGVFEAFPSISGREAHEAGGGGDIFRDVERMNEILARPAQVYKLDVLMLKTSIS